MKTAVKQYLDYLRYERHASPATVQSYGDDLESYVAYVEARLGELPEPGAGDLDLVRGWLSSQMDRGLKASSVSRRLSAVKGLYRYLLRLERIKRNPISSLRPPRGARPLPIYVPTAEIDGLLADNPDDADAEGIRDQLIIAMLYECGLRRSELASLRDVDVDTAERRLKVLGKGRKERIVPFGNGLTEMIERWRRTRQMLFGNTNSFFVTLKGKAPGSAMTGQGVYQVVHRALESVPNLSRRGAHALRHSFATDMLNAGADLLAIKELMGHSKVSTTIGYTHTSFRQIQKMYNAHPRAQKKK